MTDMSRTDSTQAMKNILSAYGDEEVADEEEEEEEDEEEAKSEEEAADEPADEADDHSDKLDYNISNSEDDEPKPATIVTPIKRVVEDASSQDNTPKKIKTGRAAATKLVSYGRDEIEDDEIEDDAEDSDSEKIINYGDSLPQEANETEVKGTLNGVHLPLIELPPEPTERCSNKLQVKILKLYQKMQNGMDLNASIQRRKDFRNPNIYEKLISYCNIDEKGTNYPPELYDPSLWGKESYFDELAKAQKIEMDKREKERKERTKVEFVTGTKKQTSDGTIIEHKRKSKWDSQPSGAVSKPIIITTNIINPPVVTITTSSSGIKTAIISATGTLKKTK